jgi:hypothetical protein
VTQIDTSNTDGFRQGVEITQPKHFDAGLVKIWSGEKDSVSLRCNVGTETTAYGDVTLTDKSYSGATQTLNSTPTARITTNPILYNSVDYVAVREIMFNGVLEPLTIRNNAIDMSSNTLRNAHSCNGTVGSGNSDSEKKSDMLLSVDEYNSTFAPYNDAKISNQRPRINLVGYFVNNNVIKPFFDDRLLLNFGTDNSRDNIMNAAISLMTGSTENYVNHNERSMPSGFVYDNCSVGTNSIAFGGMGY